MDHDPIQGKHEALTASVHETKATPELGQPGPVESQAVKGSKIGYDFIAAVLGCTFIGWLIDRFLDTKPWAVVVMLIVGFIMGVYGAWRSLSQTSPD